MTQELEDVSFEIRMLGIPIYSCEIPKRMGEIAETVKIGSSACLEEVERINVGFKPEIVCGEITGIETMLDGNSLVKSRLRILRAIYSQGRKVRCMSKSLWTPSKQHYTSYMTSTWCT